MTLGCYIKKQSIKFDVTLAHWTVKSEVQVLVSAVVFVFFFFLLTQGLSFHTVSLNSIPDSNLNIVES